MNYLLEFISQSNVFAAVLGGAIVWVLTQMKSINEIRKLDKEVVSIRVMLNKELYSLEEQRKAYAKQTNDHLKELLHFIKADDKSRIPETWDKVNDVFFTNYLTASHQITRTSKILSRGDRNEIKDLIDDELFPLLKLSLDILGVLNRTEIHAVNRQRKIKVADPTFGWIFKTIGRNISFWDFKRKRKLESYKERFEKYK